MGSRGSRYVALSRLRGADLLSPDPRPPANCRLTDAVYDLGTNDSYDAEVGLHLLNHNSNPAYTGDCELTLED